MTSELTYGTLIFYEDLLVNSEHLSSANLICPNLWLLVLSFSIRISILKQLFKGFFLIERMCQKMDSQKLTQKVWWSIKGLVVDLSILFLWVFQFMEGHKRLSWLFSGNLLAMLWKIFAWPFRFFQWLLRPWFFRFAWSKFHYITISSNLRQFKTKRQMKNTTKLVPFLL